MIERIDPPKPGTSPFSGAVVAGPFVFVSGQVGTDPRTGTTPSGFKAQTENVLANSCNVRPADRHNLRELRHRCVIARKL